MGLRPDAGLYDFDQVVALLEDAGKTLTALRVRGTRPAEFRSNMPEPVREMMDAYGWTAADLPLPEPSARQVTRMDETLAWIRFIPTDRYVLRRIVGARCLVNPKTDRNTYSWRRIAGLIGSDHKAVQRWHAQGIQLIVGGLNKPLIMAANVA